ncbi:MAG: TRAP transporter small permease [Minwuia sp.]|nr:TRAP transporter small permease [Minwuia sp.]
MSGEEHRQGGAAASPSTLDRLVTPVIWLGGAVSTVLILAMLVVTVHAVVMRYVLNTPLLWADEVTGWSLVAIVTLGAAEAYRRNDHIAIDILFDRTRGYPRWLLESLGHAAALGLAVIIGLSTWDAISFARSFGVYTSGHIEIETWYLQTPILIGSVLLGLIGFVRLVGTILRGRES